MSKYRYKILARLIKTWQVIKNLWECTIKFADMNVKITI